MPRGSRRARMAREPHRELDLTRAHGGAPRREERRGAQWYVREVGGEKIYLCPGCLQDIVPGTPHLVVWAADSLFGDESALAERRHWHKHCWKIGQ